MKNTSVNIIQFIFSIVLLIAGILLLLNSLELGKDVMSGVMARNGGSMSTDTYLLNLGEAIANFQYMGAALMAVGGLGSIMALGRNSRQ